jgi:phage shock protein C
MSDLRFENDPVRSPAPSRAFRLNKAQGKLMGVCAGIADYLGWDVTLVRIGWVIASLAGFASPILVYLAIGFIAD